MNSTKSKLADKPKYPMLIEFATGTVILMADSGTGTVVYSGDTSVLVVGDHWSTDADVVDNVASAPFSGTITLAN